MSIVAAFLWRKSPRPSVSTLIFNQETMEILQPASIYYFSNKLFSFRKEAKKIIKFFFEEIIKFHLLYDSPIILEYRIVFHSPHIFYLTSSKQSQLIYYYFFKEANKLKKKYHFLKVQPQLRNRLSGKNLIKFKKILRSLELVSRKRTTGYEYFLWAVALHATPKTFEETLRKIKTKLMNQFWESY